MAYYYNGGMYYQPTNTTAQPPSTMPQAYPQPTTVPSYPSTFPRYIPGQMVNSLQDISPADVPMSGESWFPFADGSKVVAKRWNTDGTIETKVYVLSEEKEPSDPIKAIEERLARIEKDLYSEKEGAHERQH